MLEPTALSGNAAYLESLYDEFLRDPSKVGDAWGRYFESMGASVAGGTRTSNLAPAPADLAASRQTKGASPSSVAGDPRQAAVSRLIQIWSNRGHLIARTDPLGLTQRPVPRVLDLAYFGLTEADLDKEFFTGSRTDAIPQRMRLRDILAQLQFIYAGPLGAEFAHVSNSEARLWLQGRSQRGRLRNQFTRQCRIYFL